MIVSFFQKKKDSVHWRARGSASPPLPPFGKGTPIYACAQAPRHIQYFFATTRRFRILLLLYIITIMKKEPF